MDNLYIEGDYKSPTLDFNYEKGELVIKGRSLPEHAVNVYKPALEWLENYSKSPKAKTTVSVSLEYFNTSSSKLILDIFKRIDKMHKDGNVIEVNWYYEDDDYDLQDEGETFQEILSVPVNLVPIKEFDFTFIIE